MDDGNVNDLAAKLDVASLRDEASGKLDAAITRRRQLHRFPEVGNDLPTTRQQVLEAIDGLPVAVTLHETTSGIAALLDGGKPGPTVLLRGDMDALPMPEETGLEFSSQNDGAMHACGHDAHTAMLIGAAEMLTERRGDLAGRVLFMFQPGEEGHHGARFMLDEGLLDVPPLADGTPSPITEAFALHIFSGWPSGHLLTRRGPTMASADRIVIDIIGTGGHASEPHRTHDPIPVACELVQALQTMITRRVNVFDPAVLTIARITAGTTNNVIPETAQIEGTMRTVSAATRRQVQDHLQRVAEHITAAHGLTAEVLIDPGYPVTVNDDDHVGRTLDIGRAVVGSDRVTELPSPIMGAEDFSYVLQKVPGTMMFLGGTPEGADLAAAAPNHSPRVMFDEAAMATGIATYTAVALDALSP